MAKGENIMTGQNDLWKTICERDVAWEDYCTNPSDKTWEEFVNLDKKEKRLQRNSGQRFRSKNGN